MKRLIKSIYFIRSAYTTPSTVKEVSAMFVATINRLQFGGAGLNTRTCRENSKKKPKKNQQQGDPI